MEFNITNILDNIKEHQDLINEAYEVFHSGQAGDDKSFIIDLFKKADGKYKADIKLRLAVIDSLYSTQAKDLEAVTRKIHEISNRESNIGQRFINFLGKCDDEEIRKVIENKHGRSRHVSLITKYIYFLTERQFPIYDKFVVKALENLSDEIVSPLVQGKKIYGLDGIPDNFFESIYKISNQIGENGVDRFDAFCWTWGKIAESEAGEVSVFDKDKSKTFCQKLIDAELLTK